MTKNFLNLVSINLQIQKNLENFKQDKHKANCIQAHHNQIADKEKILKNIKSTRRKKYTYKKTKI